MPMLDIRVFFTRDQGEQKRILGSVSRNQRLPKAVILEPSGPANIAAPRSTKTGHIVIISNPIKANFGIFPTATGIQGDLA